MKKIITKVFLLPLLMSSFLMSNPTSLSAQCGTPTLTGVPSDIFLPCGSPLPAWPAVTAFDLCDTVPVTRSQHQAGTKCGNIFYERHWTATGVDNTATAIQTIRFLDETPPVLDVPADITIDCSEPVPAPHYVSSDACSWNDVKFSETRTDQGPCEYTLVRTWTATDGCGNQTKKSQTIKVVDEKGPVIKVVNPALKDIKLGEEIEMNTCESPQTLVSDVIATDCCDDVTVEAYDRILIHGQCDRFGFYRKWRCGYIATDEGGNTTEFYFFVIQYDNEAAVLHNVPDDMTLECDDTIPAIDYDLVEVEDNCSHETKPEITEEYFYDPADSNNLAVKRIWYFQDACGNEARDSQWILTCDFDPLLIDQDTIIEPDTTVCDTIITVMDTITVNDTMTVMDTVTVMDTITVMDTVTVMDTLTVMDTMTVIDSVAVCDSTVFDTMTVFDTIVVVDTIIVMDTITIMDTVSVDTSMAGDALFLPGGSVKDLEVFPNPTRGHITLQFDVPRNDRLQIQLVDKTGKLIEQMTANYEAGQHRIDLDLTKYPNGYYSVQLIGDSGFQQSRIIKTE